MTIHTTLTPELMETLGDASGFRGREAVLTVTSVESSDVERIDPPMFPDMWWRGGPANLNHRLFNGRRRWSLIPEAAKCFYCGGLTHGYRYGTGVTHVTCWNMRIVGDDVAPRLQPNRHDRRRKGLPRPNTNEAPPAWVEPRFRGEP